MDDQMKRSWKFKMKSLTNRIIIIVNCDSHPNCTSHIKILNKKNREYQKNRTLDQGFISFSQLLVVHVTLFVILPSAVVITLLWVFPYTIYLPSQEDSKLDALVHPLSFPFSWPSSLCSSCSFFLIYPEGTTIVVYWTLSFLPLRCWGQVILVLGLHLTPRPWNMISMIFFILSLNHLN